MRGFIAAILNWIADAIDHDERCDENGGLDSGTD